MVGTHGHLHGHRGVLLMEKLTLPPSRERRDQRFVVVMTKTQARQLAALVKLTESRSVSDFFVRCMDAVRAQGGGL